MTPQDAPAPSSLPDAAPACDGAVARSHALVEAQLLLVDQLAEAGLEIVLALAREVAPQAADTAAPPRAPADPCAIALAYWRVSRAMRMSVMLQSRLMRDLDQTGRPSQWDTAGAAAETDAPETEAAEPRAERGERAERETVERLDDDEDLYRQVMTAPVGETIDRICRDLGFSPDWLAPADEVRVQAALTGDDVGAPLAALKTRAREKPRPRPIKGPDRRPKAASP